MNERNIGVIEIQTRDLQSSTNQKPITLKQTGSVQANQRLVEKRTNHYLPGPTYQTV